MGKRKEKIEKEKRERNRSINRNSYANKKIDQVVLNKDGQDVLKSMVDRFNKLQREFDKVSTEKDEYKNENAVLKKQYKDLSYGVSTFFNNPQINDEDEVKDDVDSIVSEYLSKKKKK